MIRRRKTRETLRHERAVVLQALGTPTADDVRKDIAANQLRAAELRRAVMRGGESDEARLGVVTGKPVAGGNGTIRSPEPPAKCKYCRVVGGHNGNCPMVS